MNALDQLDLILTTLEAEDLLRDAQFAAGMIPPDVTRPLEPWEESTDWVAIAAALGVAYTAVETALEGFRQVYLDDLTRVVTGTSGATAWARFLAWTQQLPRDVRKASDRAVRQIAQAYSTLQGQSSRILAQDAQKAGVGRAVERYARPGSGIDRWVPLATSPVLYLPARTVQAVTSAIGVTPPSPESIVAAARAVAMAGAVDLGRQGAHQAAGAGRLETARAITADGEFESAYSSELLDGATCQPCSAVDSRSYETLDEALIDYPGFGGYKDCDGGARCRGTVVITWKSETPPTEKKPYGDEPDDYSDVPGGEHAPFRRSERPQGTDEDWQHIIDRHAFGRNQPNASEWPQGWTKEKMQEAVDYVLVHPKNISPPDAAGIIYFQGVVDGRLIDVQIARKRPDRIRTAYAVNGPGVFHNSRRKGRTEMPFDLRRLRVE